MLPFSRCLTTPAVQQLHAGNSDTAKQNEQASQCQGSKLACAQTRLRRKLVLQAFQLATQWLAVANDRGLGFTGRNQPLQVAQNGAGLRAGLFVELDQRFELFACLRILGGRQAQLRAAIKQALGNFLERVQVLTQQKHGLGAHAFHGLEFVGRFTDTLGQHHQLTGSRNFGGWRVLLQLERRHGFSDLQQIRRLAVDGAQRVTYLHQDFLLAHDHAGVAFRALHERGRTLQVGLELLTEGLDAQFAVAAVESTHIAGQHP